MMRLTPAIHDALRRRCPRCMCASSTHARGTLPPTSIVFLAIPTLYMKDNDLRLCARLVSRARYAFCSHVPLPRPPVPPPTYSPAFAGRCARAASAFPRPVHDACDDGHRCRGRCQDRAGRLCTHSSRCATSIYYILILTFFSKRSHPTKQRPRRDVCDDDDDHDTKMCSRISCARGAACTSSQSLSTGNAAPVAKESTGRLREWGARHAARVRALSLGTSTLTQVLAHP
ncbi:hypothetical protein DFH09DRAFT_1203290 [Mycena vulgaris]|nr:hypothetical protein DFH09DRAFT_1203290 [Mycena vulgaris]